MGDSLVSRLRQLADEADKAARSALEARDADYDAGRADAYREAALLVMDEAGNGS